MTLIQTTFLGASIRSFSANVGWNEQTSTLTTSLVEDPRNGDSFSRPEPGTPVSFVIDDFRFDGIVQSWEEKRSVQGYPVFDVTITDPRELLQGCYVIINGYDGVVTGIPNLFNAYGYWEFSLGFGGAEANEAGMPYYKVISALQSMTIGSSSLFGGPYVKFKGFNYTLDFTALPLTPIYYRLSNDSMSIMEIVSQVCQDSGCDFLVRMTYNTNEEYHTISFVPTSRSEQPSLTLVQDYINSRPEVIQKSRGLELRNETTSVFVVGGNKQELYIGEANNETESAATIWPYWGLDSNGDVIIGSGIDDDHTVTVDSRTINVPGVEDTYTFTVGELRAALHNQDSWMAYICYHDLTKAAQLGMSSYVQDMDTLANSILKVVSAIDIQNTSKDKARSVFVDKDLTQSLTLLYEFVRAYAHDYYGKKYMVRLPSLSVKRESETEQIITSFEPVDSAFLTYADWLNGNSPLDLPTIYEDLFTEQDGKFQCFVRFNNASQYDLSKIDAGDSIVVNNMLYVKATIESFFVYLDSETFYSPRAVITLNGPINELPREEDVALYQEGLLKLLRQLETSTGINAEEKLEELTKNSAGGLAIGPMGPSTNMPENACIPLKSNTSMYGPWLSIGAEGKVRFEKNDSLVPWNFNGYTFMNYAADAIVVSALTLQQAGEMGVLEIPGTPDVQIGDELIAGGPNVTGIDVTFSDGGVTTSYRLRTYTPTFGQFSKQNADRFQRMARSAQEIRRSVIGANRTNSIANSAYINRMYLQQGASPPNTNTPHTAIVSKLVETTNNRGDSIYKTITSVGTVQELLPSLNSDDDTEYKKTGFVSLDSLFKPFSSNFYCTDKISHLQPPQIKGRSFTSQDSPEDRIDPMNIGVTSFDYYPFGPSQSGGFMAHSGSFNRDYIGGSGFDGTYASFGNTYPVNGLRTNQDSFNFDDVRGIAFANPMIITGWGMDIFARPVPGEFSNDEIIPKSNITGNYYDSTDLNYILDGGTAPTGDTRYRWDGFLSNYRQRPDMWKTGPLDIRWCPIRKVWTSAGSLYAGIYQGNNTMRLKNSDITIAVIDWLGNGNLASGVNVVAGFCGGELIIMSAGGCNN